MIRISQDKLNRQIETYISNGIPFYFRVTNQRQEIISAAGRYMNKESQFPSNELNFIKQVKHQIIRDNLFEQIPNKFKTKAQRKKIKYYSYNPKFKEKDVVNNCYEVDMKSAYWEMLNNVGMLSEKLYEKGKKVSKESRLAAVGSLAKKTEVYYFDGKKQHELPPERSILTEHIWHHVCNEVGKILMEIAKSCGNDFLFFWVDAMFVKHTSLEKVKAAFQKHGYNFSVDKCKYIEFKKKHLVVKGRGKWIEKNGKRYFSTEREFPFRPFSSLKDLLSEKHI